MSNNSYSWKEHLRALESFDRPGEVWTFNFDNSPTTDNNSSNPNSSSEDNDFYDTYDYRDHRSDKDVVNIVQDSSKSAYVSTYSSSGNPIVGIILGLLFIIMPLTILILFLSIPTQDTEEATLDPSFECITGTVIECESSSHGSGYDITVIYDDTELTCLASVAQPYEKYSSIVFYQKKDSAGYTMTPPYIYGNQNDITASAKTFVACFMSIFIIVGLIVMIISIKSLKKK